ncbi:MAG: helix-turn-helix domain-containing protein [Pseudomonadales bacterium]|nr:helix-turn-helix domain-containing protein [Pseudomonadales bacterium]
MITPDALLSSQTLLTSLVGMLFDFMNARQLELPELRQRLLDHQHDARLPLAIWLDALDELAITCPEPGLGLKIAEHIRTDHTGIVGYLCLASTTLGEALLRTSRYARLLADTIPASLQSSGADTVELVWIQADGIYGLLPEELAVAAFWVFVQRISDWPLHIKSVQLASPCPGNEEIYGRWFGCEVKFAGQDTRIRFDNSFLQAPVKLADPGLASLLEQQAQAMFMSLPTHDTLSQNLQRCLLKYLPEGGPDLPLMAHELGISRRQLQRLLAQRGLTFQTLLRRTREQLAKRYLADPNLNLTDIAMLLGFSEQSAFSRAFTRYAGQNPRNYRQQVWAAQPSK